jgi:hypothetical protein|tara:strand:- start:4495 stop:4905 length:411 start_codon:yes stop_codon:yes gene_type:complete
MDKYLSKEERRKMNTFNRSNGRSKQMRAKELLGVPERKYGGKSSDEEHWNSEVRFEVKSGNQVEPIATRFYKAEKQSSEYAGRQKDGMINKPFAMVAMPHGTGDGIVLCRLSDLKKVVYGVLENWEAYEKQNNEEE